MISLLEVAERIHKGPKMEEKDWDLGIFKKMGELTKKYGIAYPKDGSYFNLDDEMAEAAFRAAVEFLVDRGVYCLSTRRVVKFDKKEVLEAIAEAPNAITVGEGMDARVIKQKRVEGEEMLGQCPGHHAPFTEQMAPLVVKNFAQIASTDYLEGFNFTVVDGRDIFGIPLEAYAARREVAWLREGVRKAGRPGLAVAYYPINTKASTLIAPMDPDYGLRRTDGVLLSILPDTKMEQDMLTAAIVYDEYGCFKVNGGANSPIGGFCGGAEGAAIEAIAKTIAGWIVYRDTIFNTGVWDINVTTKKKIDILPQQKWGCSLVLQGLNNHTNFISNGVTHAQSGPGTETHLIEMGIIAVNDAINGANLYIVRQARARMDASQTPLEAEFMMEVANATVRARIGRKEGNRVLKKLIETIQGRDVEPGCDHVNDCYDWVHHQPYKEYAEIYENVKQVFRNCGIPV
ncbi:MAG: monomethylamine:corrinoid methyltransferase [Spirochaetaceae bacterium]|nr:MAG: monomethylamine:corrinoid methyltransferase [Spirochaetaceae bacterium]